MNKRKKRYEVDEHEMTDERRKSLMIKFRDIYIGAKNVKARRAADIALCEVTDGLNDHNDLFPNEDWEYPCSCDSCKSYAG